MLTETKDALIRPVLSHTSFNKVVILESFDENKNVEIDNIMGIIICYNMGNILYRI